MALDLNFKPLRNEYFIDNLTYIEYKGEEHFIGRLGVIYKGGRGEKYLDTMKNSSQELVTINPVLVRIVTNRLLEILVGFKINDPDDHEGELFYDW